MTQLSSQTRALLQSAKAADGPSPHTKARIERALAGAAVGSSVTLAVATAEASIRSAASSTGLWAILTTGKAAVVTSIAVGMATGSVVMASANHFAPPAPAPKAAMARPVAKATATLPRVVQAPTSPVPITTSATEPPLEIAATGTPLASPSTARASIAQETQQLALVQQALREGASERALLLLGQYRRDFGEGALAEEAAAVEVFARCAVGKTTATEQARTRFLSRYPGSPLEPRVRAACANTKDE